MAGFPLFLLEHIQAIYPPKFFLSNLVVDHNALPTFCVLGFNFSCCSLAPLWCPALLFPLGCFLSSLFPLLLDGYFALLSRIMGVTFIGSFSFTSIFRHLSFSYLFFSLFFCLAYISSPSLVSWCFPFPSGSCYPWSIYICILEHAVSRRSNLYHEDLESWIGGWAHRFVGGIWGGWERTSRLSYNRGIAHLPTYVGCIQGDYLLRIEKMPLSIASIYIFKYLDAYLAQPNNALLKWDSPLNLDISSSSPSIHDYAK